MTTQQSVSEVVAEMRYSGALTCAVGVSDFRRSMDWYRDVLGFEPLYSLDEMAWAELVTPIPGVTLGVGETEQVQPEGGATLTFGVEDIEATRARLESLGVRFDGATSQVGDMVRLATFYDPDGNTFMLAQVLDEKLSRH